jgi:hypothetical protein
MLRTSERCWRLPRYWSVSQVEQGIVFGSIEALPHDHRGVVHGRHLEAQEAGECSKS